MVERRLAWPKVGACDALVTARGRGESNCVCRAPFSVLYGSTLLVLTATMYRCIVVLSSSGPATLSTFRAMDNTRRCDVNTAQ